VKRLLIRNGRVVDPSLSLDQGMDVLLEDGHVAALAERLDAPPDAEILDAVGLVIAPGFIDLHCHLREPGFEHKETLESGSRAAAAGGYTAVCCMANTDPVNDTASVTRYILERAAEVGVARVYPVGAATSGRRGQELAEIGGMVREGVVAVSDSPAVIENALVMRRTLEYSRSFEVPVIVHAKDPDLAANGQVHEGEVATRIGLHAIPGIAEELIVARDLLLAELTRGRLHFAHLSTAGSFEMIRGGKRKGILVTCAVEPNHLLLTDEDLAASNYNTNFKVDPPLRTAADVEAALQAVYDGTVDAIVSGHAPHHTDEKDLDFADAPFGAVGLETAVSLLIDRLVHERVIGLPQLVRLLSTGPAEVLGLPGGTLKVGTPADPTLLSLRKRVTVDPERFVSRSRNTPFAGRSLRGAPAMTIVGGEIVWKAE